MLAVQRRTLTIVRKPAHLQARALLGTQTTLIAKMLKAAYRKHTVGVEILIQRYAADLWTTTERQTHAIAFGANDAGHLAILLHKLTDDYQNLAEAYTQKAADLGFARALDDLQLRGWIRNIVGPVIAPKQMTATVLAANLSYLKTSLLPDLHARLLANGDSEVVLRAFQARIQMYSHYLWVASEQAYKLGMQLRMQKKLREVGTASSGDHGHVGNPGHVGGSGPSNGAAPALRVLVPVSAGAGKDKYSNIETPNGGIVRGTPIAWDDPRIPATVYHVTTNADAVESSGLLRAAGEGGLGGDKRDQIVSLTVSKDIADGLKDDMQTMVRVAQAAGPEPPYVPGGSAEREAFGRKVTDAFKVEAKRQGWNYDLDNYDNPNTMGTYGLSDWSSHFFMFRKSDRANPIFMGVTQPAWAKLNTSNIATISIPKENLNTGSLLTDFDLGQHSLEEVRSYGDVPITNHMREALRELLEIGTASSGDHNHPGNPGHVGGSGASGPVVIPSETFHSTAEIEDAIKQDPEAAIIHPSYFSVKEKDLGLNNNSGDILIDDTPVGGRRLQTVFSDLAQRMHVPMPEVQIVERMSGRSGETTFDGKVRLGIDDGANYRVALHEFAHWVHYQRVKDSPVELDALKANPHNGTWQATFGDVAKVAAEASGWHPGWVEPPYEEPAE